MNFNGYGYGNYNNYQSYLPQYQPVQQPQTTQQQNTGVNWVHGEADARAFNVPAGSSVWLMDADEQIFYIKSVDYSGMPQVLRRFKFEEIGGNTPPTPAKTPTEQVEYITRKEFEEAISKLKKEEKAYESTISADEQ